MCKHAVKKITLSIIYVPDRHKTEHMCEKAILENNGTLTSVPDCYKNEEKCNKATDNYPNALDLFLNAL